MTMMGDGRGGSDLRGVPGRRCFFARIVTGSLLISKILVGALG